MTPTSRPGLGRSANRRPLIVAVPDVGVVSPTIMRMDVDLPAPLGPRKPVTRPGRALKVMSWTTVLPPYFLDRFWMVIMQRTLGIRRGAPRRREVASWVGRSGQRGSSQRMRGAGALSSGRGRSG